MTLSLNKTTRILAAALVAVASIFAPAHTAHAQSAPYKFDFGAALGMSGYLGDANTSNLLKHPGYVAELNMRYIPNTRFAIRAVLGTMSLSGNTADMQNVLPGGRQYSFKAQVVDLGVRGEFNFFAYGIGETYKSLKRWSPYLTAGIGVCLSSCGGNTAFAPTLPMGIGIKYKVRERINLGAEFTMTKAFSDKIDGPDLADLTTIKTSFIKNTDWYSRLTFSITYEFGKRCETCHYVD